MTSTAPVSTYRLPDTASALRVDDAPPTGDPLIDDAHDNTRAGLAFFSEVLGRSSYDDQGTAVKVYTNTPDPLNATWNKETKAVYVGSGGSFRPGEPVLLKPFARGLDVITHELAHGVVNSTAGLRYENQSGALNESFADVFGEAAEQWHEDRAGFGSVEAARRAEWLIGEDVSAPDLGHALRDFARPGTANRVDPQIGHMDDYQQTTRDWGGVHINSGIPNRAAYEVAQQVGTEKLAKVWYHALTTGLEPTSTFTDAARATVESAELLYGEPVTSAVQDAWESVGVLQADAPA